MYVTPAWDYEWIADSSALQAAIESILREELISLDTETVGWKSGNERLALIQIGLPTQKKVLVVDPLAIEDLSSLTEPLTSELPRVIAHNAAFEEKQFKRYSIAINGVIDTLDMARALRPDLPRHTLQVCCKVLLGVDISKAEQVSDWAVRPLSDEQLVYARLDAELAFMVYEKLAAMQERLMIDETMDVPKLMEQYADTLRERIRITQEVAPDLALLMAREVILKEKIRAKLVAGEPAYEGEFGTAEIKKTRRTEVNPALVRQLFPEIADMVIRQQVERAHLVAVMREQGIDEKRLKEVLTVIGTEDRFTFSAGGWW
jgi:ribonuclease D